MTLLLHRLPPLYYEIAPAFGWFRAATAYVRSRKLPTSPPIKPAESFWTRHAKWLVGLPTGRA